MSFETAAALYVLFLLLAALWQSGHQALKKCSPVVTPWKADEATNTTNQKGGAA